MASLLRRTIHVYSKHNRILLSIGICCSIFIYGLVSSVYRTCVSCYTMPSSTSIFKVSTNETSELSSNSSRVHVQCSLKELKDLNCRKLTIGDIKELQTAIRYINHHKNESKCQLSSLAENCISLKLSHDYVTDVNKITSEELKFPLAFAIKIHTNPEQAEQLFRTIYRPHNVYCIYVDKKAEAEVFNVMKKIAGCFENVLIVENRINIVYSSINLVQAELTCMRLLTKTNYTWKYYINLTGQEFPLKTNFELINILQKLNRANDIESYDFPFIFQKRYTKQYIIKNNAIVKTNLLKPSFIKKFQMSKGSAYGAFSRPFVEYVLTDDIAVSFVKWLNGTYAPEESAWATLNSLPWAPGGYSRAIRHATNSFLSRAIVWSWDGLKCHGHYVRGICVFGVGDLLWLVNRPELFANKFDTNFDPIVINCLEEILKSRTKENRLEHLNWHYYNTLPHVEFYSKMKPVQTKEYLQNKKDVWLREHNITLKHAIKM